MIESIGLAGDLRGTRIYGPAAKHMRRVGSHTGLWQDPGQISSALLRLGSFAWPPSATRGSFEYVEVGVYTAWTCVLISSYLRRTAAGMLPFGGHAVDIKAVNIHADTFDLMKRLNVSFESRHNFDRRMKSASPPRFDACFIDGDHGYNGVKGDYSQMAPRCSVTMFHDIQDSSTMIHDSFSGGVPMFWTHARAHVRRERVVELTKQGSPYWPVFGIGILLPGPSGTAEPDDGSSVASWPAWHGSGPEALWRALCVAGSDGAYDASERLPAQYVAWRVLCPQANSTNLESILLATKRSVPRPLLTYAMGLPWHRSDK